MDVDVADQNDNQSLTASDRGGAAKSVEGWVLIATNIHEEAQEEDVYDMFADYGDLTYIQVPLDRRTGYVKGYAVLEYSLESEAKKAIDAMNGKNFFGRKIKVDWAFRREPIGSHVAEH